MRPQSAKAKGRRLQQLVRDRLLAAYPQLEADDVRSTSMGAGGEDLLLSPAARRLIPWNIECKARAGLKTLYGWYDQASGHGQGEPVLVVKMDRREPLALVDLGYLINLLPKER